MKTSAPCPGRDSIRSVPPIALNRSCIAINPSPSRCAVAWTWLGSNPLPSSRIAQHNASFSLHARIHKFFAFACLTALVSAS